MDYFSVIVLIIVIFVFVSDRKVKNINDIKQIEENLDEQLLNIKDSLEIIRLSTANINYKNILKNIQDNDKDYILVLNNKVKLNDKKLNIIIANFIHTKYKPCGFNLLYEYKSKKFSIRKIYVDMINYLNIFNRKQLSTYGAIMFKKEEYISNNENIKISEEVFSEKIISYTSFDLIRITFTKKQAEKDKLKDIYIKKINNGNISLIIKILLLIISGSIITTNLIHTFFNFEQGLSGLIISAVIYFCYSYVIRYIYKPIGNKKLVAAYIFPIYFLTYIIIYIYSLILKVIKDVHAS